jgi:hypothetical protein
MGEFPEQNIINKQAELERKMKERADFKQDIVVAIQERDSQKLVESLQRLRYHLLKLENIHDPKKRGMANTHHIRDGHWQRQLNMFLDALEREKAKPHKSRMLSEEIYFDGVSRFMLGVSPDGSVLIFPSQVSNVGVKSGWDLIENAHHLYYHEGKILNSS